MSIHCHCTFPNYLSVVNSEQRVSNTHPAIFELTVAAEESNPHTQDNCNYHNHHHCYQSSANEVEEEEYSVIPDDYFERERIAAYGSCSLSPPCGLYVTGAYEVNPCEDREV